MTKVAIRYGAVGGLILLIFMFIQFYLFNSKSESINQETLGFIGISLSLISIYLAIKYVRDRENAGKISFWQGFKLGLLVSLVVSILYVGSWLIYVQIYGPGIMDGYFAAELEKIQNSGLPAAEIETNLNNMKSMMDYYKSPLVQAVFSFFEIFPIGVGVSLIAALILQKK